MRLVVDAGTLVGELLRRRGRELLGNSHLDLYVPERMWEETRYEVSRRLALRVSRGLSESVAADFRENADRVKEQSITEVSEELYGHLRDEAISRITRDPDDWQVVALALSLESDFPTEDRDFFGCGVATWTVETLIPQLERRGESPLQS